MNVPYRWGTHPGGKRFAVVQPSKDTHRKDSSEVSTRRAQAQPEVVKMAADVRALLRTLPLLGWLLRSPEEDEAIVRRSQAASGATADSATAAAGGLCAAHADRIGLV